MDKPSPMTLSGRIRIGMAARGITSEAELARRLKMHRQTVNKWISGEVEYLEPEYLFRLADALDCNPRWLALKEGEPQKPVELDLEKMKVIQLYSALSKHPQVRDLWVKHGQDLLQTSTGPSVAQPFK